MPHAIGFTSSSAVVAALSLALVLSAFVAAPVVAAGEDGSDDRPVLTSASNKNTSEGSASDEAVALEKAQTSKKSVEVVADRSTTETVWANPDGSLSREIAQSPIRAKDQNGKLALIDTTLVDRGDRLEPKVASGSVSLSGDGSGDLATYEFGKGQSVGMRFDGGLAAPEVDGSSATYVAKESSSANVQVVGAGAIGLAASTVVGPFGGYAVGQAAGDVLFGGGCVAGAIAVKKGRGGDIPDVPQSS